jgi:hypothetical protein
MTGTDKAIVLTTGFGLDGVSRDTQRAETTKPTRWACPVAIRSSAQKAAAAYAAGLLAMG